MPVVLNFLGTGTSVGVPYMGCSCAVCSSENPKNKRFRSSVFVDLENSQGSPKSGILVDSSPELRLQMLRLGNRRLEGVFYTHDDSDHVNGIDDLRPFNFAQDGAINIYGDERTINSISSRFAYAFTGISGLEHGSPPRLTPNLIRSGESFKIAGQTVTPVLIHHGKREILGVRIKNLAYLTDCSFIPDTSRPLLEGLDILIISALRQTPHPNHLTVDQAVDEILKIKPRRAFITHISHSLEHDEMNAELQKISACKIELAYDGLALEF